MQPKTRAILLVIFVIGIWAPATGQPNGKAGGGNPEIPTSAPAANPSAYRIGAGDVLQVEVWKEPDASCPSVTVRPDGKISLPLIGETQAAGLTPIELQRALSERYGQAIRGARPLVMVKEVQSQKVYVIGEVRREGSIRMVGPLTVLQALAEVGGITEYAKRKKIYILRWTGDGQASLPFDYEAVARGQKVAQNVLLLPGDTIVVPR